MQRARPSTTHDGNTMAPRSSTSTNQKGYKRKNSQGQYQQVIGKTSNKKTKINGKDNEFADEQPPWAKCQPLSPRKMSWMLQQTVSETRENRRKMNEMKEALRLKESAEEYDETFGECWNYHPKSKQLPRYPLFTMESVDQVEKELLLQPNAGSRLMNYELLLLPHADAQQFINNILNFLMKSDLAIEFTYTGKPPRRSFKSLFLCDVIKKTVRKKFPNTEESFFSDRIANWLSACKKKYSRQINQQNKFF